MRWYDALVNLQGSQNADRRIVQLMSLAWLAVYNQGSFGTMRSLLINQHDPLGLMYQLDYYGVPTPENLERLAPSNKVFISKTILKEPK